MSLLDQVNLQKRQNNSPQRPNILGMLEAGKHSEARKALKTLDKDSQELVNSYVQQRYGFKL